MKIVQILARVYFWLVIEYGVVEANREFSLLNRENYVISNDGVQSRNQLTYMLLCS